MGCLYKVVVMICVQGCSGFVGGHETNVSFLQMLKCFFFVFNHCEGIFVPFERVVIAVMIF